MPIDYRKIGNNIRLRREALNYSQEYVALECNVCPSFISRIENGQKKISLAILMDIAQTLEVSVGYLLDEPGNDPDMELSTVLSGIDYDERKFICKTLKILKSCFRDEKWTIEKIEK